MTTHDAACPDAGLPINPFLALRATYGMLLGEHDFRDLMGNARGKQMLHAAWLHGGGVVWGFPVTVRAVPGGYRLDAGPGLAVDRLGRELRAEKTLNSEEVGTLFADQDPPLGCVPGGTRTENACLLLRFDTCLTDPVPTLTDPCDVTRSRDTFSRVVERAALCLRLGRCPEPPVHHPRVRALLGLFPPTPGQVARDVAEAVATIRAAAPDEIAATLLQQFRRLAALDVTELDPPRPEDDPCPPLFPVLDEDAAIPLAALTITVRDDPDGHIQVVKVVPDPTIRPALLPTAAIQELACGWAPGVLGEDTTADEGGPRIDPDSLNWSDDRTRLTFRVTKELNPWTLRNAVEISSLGPRGWVRQDLADVDVAKDDPRLVVVDLAEERDHPVYRLVVRGTGPAPAVGVHPRLPLAGVVGGPPGTADDGHDAVLTRHLPHRDRRADA